MFSRDTVWCKDSQVERQTDRTPPHEMLVCLLIGAVNGLSLLSAVHNHRH